jgi:uncharacterized membrane protein
MASLAAVAHGTKFQRAGVNVLEVTKIGDMSVEAGEVDATSTDSGGWTESLPGLLSAKDLTIEGNLRLDDSTGQMALAADQIARTINTYGIVGPVALPFAWTFLGWVKSFKTIQPVKENEVAKFQAVIAITGSTGLTFSSSSNLTALTVSIGSLVPAFAAGTYDYIDALTNGTASVTITVTNAAAQSLKVDVYNSSMVLQSSQTLTSGVASSAITTPVGTTILDIITRDSGKVPKHYTVKLGRTS